MYLNLYWKSFIHQRNTWFLSYNTLEKYRIWILFPQSETFDNLFFFSYVIFSGLFNV